MNPFAKAPYSNNQQCQEQTVQQNQEQTVQRPPKKQRNRSRLINTNPFANQSIEIEGQESSIHPKKRRHQRLHEKQKERDKYITFTNLQIERDWSKRLITKFLGEPDKLGKNINNSKTPCKLYELEKVYQIEETEEFKVELRKVIKRRESANKVVSKKEDELLNYINSLEINIPHFENRDELFKAARAQYNNHQIEKGTYNIAHKDADIEFMKRITINFLRHSVDCYEIELHRLFGKIGRTLAYFQLKDKINDAILEKYPYLQ